MDLAGIVLSEISQRKTNTVCFYFYVESKKIKKKTHKHTQNRNRFIDTENKLMVARGEAGGGHQ